MKKFLFLISVAVLLTLTTSVFAVTPITLPRSAIAGELSLDNFGVLVGWVVFATPIPPALGVKTWTVAGHKYMSNVFVIGIDGVKTLVCAVFMAEENMNMFPLTTKAKSAPAPARRPAVSPAVTWGKMKSGGQ